MKHTRGERIFYTINALLLAIVGIVCLFPFLYVISVSLTPLTEVMKHNGFLVIPRDVTFAAYKQVFMQSSIPQGFKNTVIITLVSVALSLVITSLMAFGLAKKEVPGRKIYLFLVVFTILFHGGIIPTFLVVKSVGLLNSLWALIIPNMIVPLNLLIMKTFFEQIPPELEDAAVIDGSGEYGILRHVVLPLSAPVLATIGLFYAVQNWNIYFLGILYISDPHLYPLQVVLRQLFAAPDPSFMDAEVAVPPETMKMAAVVVSTLPIVMVYPFLQKYFVKGANLGAVKG